MKSKLNEWQQGIRAALEREPNAVADFVAELMAQNAPRPYWENERVKVFHGFGQQLVQRIGAVDAVVMDPPYASGGFTEATKKATAGMGLRSETVREIGWFEGDSMTTAGVCWLLHSVACWCSRIMTEGATLTTFTDWRMVAALAPAIEGSGLRFQNMIVWAKQSAGLGTGFKATHELALHFALGTPKYYALDGSNVIHCKRMNPRDRVHQTQKPVELMAEIVRVVSDVEQVVLDPFAGSGSTLVAAYRLGRRAVGFELSEKNCEEIAKRFENELPFQYDDARTQTSLFQDEGADDAQALEKL